MGGVLGRSKLPPEFQESPLSQPGFSSLTSLAKQGRVIVKISGFYRCSTDSASTYSDMNPIIESLARDVPDQLVWGSDWPHTGDGAARLKNPDINVKEGFRSIDNLGILRSLRDWVGSEQVWEELMRDNSARFYK